MFLYKLSKQWKNTKNNFRKSGPCENSVSTIASHDILARAVSDSYVIKAKTNFSRESFLTAGFCCLSYQYLFVYFFAFQNSVIKIVREKYLNTTAFADKEKLQAFLSELYVFLIDQMHAALNKVTNHLSRKSHN